MLDVFRVLQNLAKGGKTQTANNVFRLHYNFTVLFLLTACIIVTTKQYVGDPINCIRVHGISESLMNTFCWIHTTFTIPSTSGKNSGKDVPFPGIDSSQNPEDFQYHKYYQWVCFMLFFQAVLFYMPRWIWRALEGGKIVSLMLELKDVMEYCGKDFNSNGEVKKAAGEGAQQDKKKVDEGAADTPAAIVVQYLATQLGQHDLYAYKYFFCESLALFNVVGQLFLMDRFFEGQFLTYGLQVIAFSEMDQANRTDPMIRIFPRVTKCRFFKFGPSGVIETHDALCIMPLNIINEKIYIFMWFWFIILAILTGLVLAFRIVIILSPAVRGYVMGLRFNVGIHRCRQELETLLAVGGLGDWFVLYMLARNVDPLVLEYLVVNVVQSLPKQKLRKSRA